MNTSSATIQRILQKHGDNNETVKDEDKLKLLCIVESSCFKLMKVYSLLTNNVAVEPIEEIEEWVMSQAAVLG